MKGKLLRIGTIILGNVFVAFAVSTLVLENQLISGGVTGLGIVTNHYTGINISLIVGIINVLLFLLGLFFIGKKFALSTLISTFAFPVLLEFFNISSRFSRLLSWNWGRINDPFRCIIWRYGYYCDYLE